MIILKDYYLKKLSPGRLCQAYDLSPDRVRRYLESEIRFVMEKIKPGDLVLGLLVFQFTQFKIGLSMKRLN